MRLSDFEGVFTPEMFGAVGDGVTDDYIALQKFFDYCYNNEATAYSDNKIYATSGTLTIKCNVSFNGGIIKAISALSSTVNIGEFDDRARDLIIQDFNVDANDLSEIGVLFKHYANIRFDRCSVINGKVSHIQVGDTGAPSSSYEAIITNVLVQRTKGVIAAGSYGILQVNNASDSIYDVGIIRDAETGIRLDTGNNVISKMHAWALPAYGSMKTCYYDNASGNAWNECQADTPSVYGWNLTSTLTRLVNCTVYINNIYGVDNTVIGVHSIASPSLTMSCCRFYGQDNTHRLASDYDLTSPTGSNIVGNKTTNCATPNVYTFIVSASTGQSFRWTNGDTFAFNHGGITYFTAVTGGFEFQTNGIGRIRIEFSGNMLFLSLGNYANDAAAAAGGVPIQGVYRNGNILQIRVV